MSELVIGLPVVIFVLPRLFPFPPEDKAPYYKWEDHQ